MSFFGCRIVCSSCSSGLASATGAKMEARMASADLPAAGGSSGAVRGTGGASSGSTASRSRSRDIVVGILGAHQLTVKQSPDDGAEAPQGALQQEPVLDGIEPATRTGWMRQRHQQRPYPLARSDLPTGGVEEPADQLVERAARQEALVSQPAHQDQQLGLDEGKLPIEMRPAEVDLGAAGPPVSSAGPLAGEALGDRCHVNLAPHLRLRRKTRADHPAHEDVARPSLEREAA